MFHYFDQAYAQDVLARMIIKARIAVAVLEVPDVHTMNEAEAVRRALISPDEYAEKYAGLRHTYYERTWFKLQAEASAMTCELFDHCIPNYAQNKYRFRRNTQKKRQRSTRCNSAVWTLTPHLNSSEFACLSLILIDRFILTIHQRCRSLFSLSTMNDI